MKNWILIFLFFLMVIPFSYSQIKDTIFIKFHDKIDLIKTGKKGDSEIWLYNILYDKELIQYKTEMKKYKKDTLHPPSIFFPVEPNQYYKYFMAGKPQLCNKINTNCIRFNYFDRKNLKLLNPHKKVIFVVKQKDDSSICFPVSFYKNVLE